MTPLSGFLLAVIAGWLARDARREAAIVIIPFLAVTAAQTYLIGAGDGHSPLSTVCPLPVAIGYWVVQVQGLIGIGLSMVTVAVLGAIALRSRSAPAAKLAAQAPDRVSIVKDRTKLNRRHQKLIGSEDDWRE